MTGLVAVPSGSRLLQTWRRKNWRRSALPAPPRQWPGDPVRPTFLIVGAQKSATRWLRINLGLHPEVYTAPDEVGFFHSDERFLLGMQWYSSQFPEWSGEPIVGEATPAYMMWHHDPHAVADRIGATLPGVRVLAVLRNPIDRALSGFVHHLKKQRLPPDTDLMEYVRSHPPGSDQLGIIAGGWYAASLRPYQRRFRTRLLVLLHDDVQRDPLGVYARAAAHVGADPGFVPPGIDQVRFSNTAPRDSPLRRPRVSGYRELTSKQRLELYEFFRADIRRLEKMIGRDLSIWHPGNRPA